MNMRSPKRNERRQNNTDSRLKIFHKEFIVHVIVFRIQNNVLKKKQATKQALQSTKHQRTQQSPEEFVGTQRPTRPVVYKTKSKSLILYQEYFLTNLPRIIKNSSLKIRFYNFLGLMEIFHQPYFSSIQKANIHYIKSA